MQCLRLSAFERRSRLDAQSDASLPCPQPLLAGVHSGGCEGSSGGEAEIADVEGRSRRRQSRRRAPSSRAVLAGAKAGAVVAEVVGVPLRSIGVDAGDGRS